MPDLETLQAQILGQIAAAHDEAALEDVRVAALGKKGTVSALLAGLGKAAPDERKERGAAINALKDEVMEALAARRAFLKKLALEARLKAEVADITLPVLKHGIEAGRIHPVSQVMDELAVIFADMGFAIAEGPDIETDDYNFTKLNIPLDHPAADAQDTFYLEPKIVLRTHTSPMQARTMERYSPPIRVVVPGLAYRRDPFDASHAPVFDQIEGLAVDEGITFVEFKGALEFFVRRFFGPTTRSRFRASFFPFTEPSAEVDIECQVCHGTGCAACKRTGFMEIMGCGMVHPAVFERCGVDPERFTGYAFGMGPLRITMLRYGIPDIRMLFDGDMRFLGQFVDG